MSSQAQDWPTVFDSSTCVRKGECPVTQLRGQSETVESHTLYFGPSVRFFVSTNLIFRVFFRAAWDRSRESSLHNGTQYHLVFMERPSRLLCKDGYILDPGL